MMMYGETFQPWPRFLAGLFSSGMAIAPLPGSPLGFSGEIERVTADESSGKLPRCIPRPLNVAIARTLLRSRAILVLGGAMRKKRGRVLIIRRPPRQNRDRRRVATTATVAAKLP